MGSQIETPGHGFLATVLGPQRSRLKLVEDIATSQFSSAFSPDGRIVSGSDDHTSAYIRGVMSHGRPRPI